MTNILMIIAPTNFRDEEYFEPKSIFESMGYIVNTASTVTGEVNGSRGGKAFADIALGDVVAEKYECVVVVGGSGSYVYDQNSNIHKIVNDFYNQNKFTTAICHAPIILAKAGLLKGKKATVFNGDAQQLINLGVNYIAKPVVQDDLLITADGPSSAKLFAITICKQLSTR